MVPEGVLVETIPPTSFAHITEVDGLAAHQLAVMRRHLPDAGEWWASYGRMHCRVTLHGVAAAHLADCPPLTAAEARMAVVLQRWCAASPSADFETVPWTETHGPLTWRWRLAWPALVLNPPDARIEPSCAILCGW